MTTNKKLVVAVIALSLALVCVVGATLAYLVAQSNVVTNTFTYGDIEIELWETDLNGTKTDSGVEYPGIVPGDTVNKNPTVTVKAKSEACWVYAKVTNNVVINGKTVANYEVNNGWTAIGSNGTTTLYRYNTKIEYSESDSDLTAVFNTVKFDDELEVDDIAALKADSNAKITVTAYAHQADHVDMADADAYAITWAGVLASN